MYVLVLPTRRGVLATRGGHQAPARKKSREGRHRRGRERAVVFDLEVKYRPGNNSSHFARRMDDDAALAREVREAREVERHVVDALRQDGTFDALRKRLVEDASSKDELRSVVANALANSAALQKIDPARKITEKETVDALREELEDTVMTAFSKELWDLMTDEQEGLGRELYEAVYAARERLKKAP